MPSVTCLIVNKTKIQFSVVAQSGFMFFESILLGIIRYALIEHELNLEHALTSEESYK